jgi:hypothetical protein
LVVWGGVGCEDLFLCVFFVDVVCFNKVMVVEIVLFV